MPTVVAQLLDRLRQSLWFIPALAVVGSAVAAVAAVWVSTLVGDEARPGGPPLFITGGAEGARAMLQAIAGSVITVAGVTFSMTIVALQLASTQFSPRVLRTFLRDIGNQIALGVFISTFTYSLLVLGTIRSSTSDEPAFVPTVAVTAAFALTLVAIGTLVFFIHHISTQIQVSTIMTDVAQETLSTIQRLWPERGADQSGPELTVPPEARMVPARRSGYVEYIAIERLQQLASERQSIIHVTASPGAWVTDGAPLFLVAADQDAADDLAAMLHRHVGLNSERSMQQDVAFGIRQLADIAIKALSPGVNDPTTAIMCIDRLVEVLTEAGKRPEPPRSYSEDEGATGVVVEFPGFAELTRVAFDQLRHYGRHDAYVALSLASAVRQLWQEVEDDRRRVLREQATWLAAAAEKIELDQDRREVLAALQTMCEPVEVNE